MSITESLLFFTCTKKKEMYLQTLLAFVGFCCGSLLLLRPSQRNAKYKNTAFSCLNASVVSVALLVGVPETAICWWMVWYFMVDFAFMVWARALSLYISLHHGVFVALSLVILAEVWVIPTVILHIGLAQEYNSVWLHLHRLMVLEGYAVVFVNSVNEQVAAIHDNLSMLDFLITDPLVPDPDYLVHGVLQFTAMPFIKQGMSGLDLRDEPA